MSLFVPKFDESVIVRDAEVPESLLEVQELYDNHFLKSEAWEARR